MSMQVINSFADLGKILEEKSVVQSKPKVQSKKTKRTSKIKNAKPVEMASTKVVPEKKKNLTEFAKILKSSIDNKPVEDKPKEKVAKAKRPAPERVIQYSSPKGVTVSDVRDEGCKVDKHYESEVVQFKRELAKHKFELFNGYVRIDPNEMFPADDTPENRALINEFQKQWNEKIMLRN